MNPQFNIQAVWGPRRETPDALANRFLNLLDRLSSIDPVFRNWTWVARGGRTAQFEAIKNRLPAEIEAAISRDDYGKPSPIYGYRFSIINSMKFQPRFVSIRFDVGSWSVTDHYANSAVLETAYNLKPDPALVAYRIFKPALLALAECFDATWCSAYSHATMQYWNEGLGEHYRLAWISYIGPRFAHLVTPPASAIVEREPNGGLLMAATDETFDVSNPAHLAAARDILAAVAPLNALPWPPEVHAPD